MFNCINKGADRYLSSHLNHQDIWIELLLDYKIFTKYIILIVFHYTIDAMACKTVDLGKFSILYKVHISLKFNENFKIYKVLIFDVKLCLYPDILL